MHESHTWNRSSWHLITRLQKKHNKQASAASGRKRCMLPRKAEQLRPMQGLRLGIVGQGTKCWARRHAFKESSFLALASASSSS